MNKICSVRQFQPDPLFIHTMYTSGAAYCLRSGSDKSADGEILLP